MSTKKSDICQIEGLCKTMCPESEIHFRCSNGMIHVLERSSDSAKKFDTSKMVKEYTRPAAGSNHLYPECLRPPDVLVKTIQYLLTLYQREKRSRFGCVYSFVCDRLRAVRQDMILQNVSAEDTIRILEAMIPFYFESGYLCRIKDCDTYNWKLHSNYLDECLSRWSEAAPHVPKHFVSSRIVCAYILHHIPLPTLLVDIYEWKKFLEDNLFHILRDIAIAYRCNNYIRFFRRLFQLPPDYVIVAAVEAVEILRRRALSTISIAYKSPNVHIPFALLSKWLHYTDICDLSDLLSYCSEIHSDSVLVSSININTFVGEECKKLLVKL